MAWRYRGYTGKVEPRLLGSYEGRNLTIVGSASRVWNDLLRWFPRIANGTTGRHDYSDVMVVNDIGMYLNLPVKHWVGLHCPHMKHWQGLRSLRKLGEKDVFSDVRDSNPILHTAERFMTADRALHEIWEIDLQREDIGGSGMFAIHVALCLGYENIVLCGMPMTNSGKFCYPPWDVGHMGDGGAQGALLWAIDRYPEIPSRVRSMSGTTMKLLGEPEWRRSE